MFKKHIDLITFRYYGNYSSAEENFIRIVRIEF